MMSCQDVAEHADAWLDHEVSSWRALRIRLHLLMCDGCARVMAQLRLARAAPALAARAEAARPATAADLARIERILVLAAEPAAVDEAGARPYPPDPG